MSDEETDRWIKQWKKDYEERPKPKTWWEEFSYDRCNGKLSGLQKLILFVLLAGFLAMAWEGKEETAKDCQAQLEYLGVVDSDCTHQGDF